MGGYGNGGSYGGATTADFDVPGRGNGVGISRSPVVSQQVERIEKVSEALHGIINELEARLSSVLMPEGPSAAAKDSGTSMVPVPLASVLNMQADRLSGACGRLQALMARIEV